MLNIWGRISSINVRKVVWCAQELGLDFQRTEAGGRFTDIDGADSISSRSSLATNGALHDDFLTLLPSPTSTGQTR